MKGEFIPVSSQPGEVIILKTNQLEEELSQEIGKNISYHLLSGLRMLHTKTKYPIFLLLKCSMLTAYKWLNKLNIIIFFDVYEPNK